MRLVFEEVFENAYVIYMNNQRVGFLSVKSNNIIQSLDINPSYIDILKQDLLRSVLFELGIDEMFLFCEPGLYKYYEEFGFERCESKKGLMRSIMRG